MGSLRTEAGLLRCNWLSLCKESGAEDANVSLFVAVIKDSFITATNRQGRKVTMQIQDGIRNSIFSLYLRSNFIRYCQV